MHTLFLAALWGCSGTTPEPQQPTPPQRALSTPLPDADHAGSVDLRELVWPMAPLDDAQQAAFCAWRKGDLPIPAAAPLFEDGTLAPAIVERDVSGTISFAGTTLPADRLLETLSAARQRWEDADSACIAAQGGVGIARVPEAALAAAPQTTTTDLLPILAALAGAEVERLNVLVDGPAGEPLPYRFDDDDVQIHATRALLRSGAQTTPTPPPGQPLPVEALGVPPDRVRCALVGLGPADSWQQAAQMLDRVAAVGARRAVLLLDDTLPPLDAPSPSDKLEDGAPTLDLSQSVAAHLLDIPQIRAPDPDGGHESACSPILYAERATPTEQRIPAELLKDLDGLDVFGAPENIGR